MFRRLNNQLRRGTDRTKEVYMEDVCEELMNFQRKGRHNQVSEGTKIRRKNYQIVRIFGIEESLGNIITYYLRILRTWEKCIQDLFTSESRRETE